MVTWWGLPDRIDCQSWHITRPYSYRGSGNKLWVRVSPRSSSRSRAADLAINQTTMRLSQYNQASPSISAIYRILPTSSLLPGLPASFFKPLTPNGYLQAGSCHVDYGKMQIHVWSTVHLELFLQFQEMHCLASVMYWVRATNWENLLEAHGKPPLLMPHCQSLFLSRWSIWCPPTNPPSFHNTLSHNLGLN